MDERRTPGQSLADYYTARRNPAGIWMGSGSAALGLEEAEVSEAQMKAPFGDGHHPDRDAMLATGAPVASTRLGAAYPRFQQLALREERVVAAIEEFEAESGRPATAPEKKQMVAREARRERRSVAGFDLVFTRSSPSPCSGPWADRRHTAAGRSGSPRGGRLHDRLA